MMPTPLHDGQSTSPILCRSCAGNHSCWEFKSTTPDITLGGQHFTTLLLALSLLIPLLPKTWSNNLPLPNQVVPKAVTALIYGHKHRDSESNSSGILSPFSKSTALLSLHEPRTFPRMGFWPSLDYLVWVPTVKQPQSQATVYPQSRLSSAPMGKSCLACCYCTL